MLTPHKLILTFSILLWTNHKSIFLSSTVIIEDEGDQFSNCPQVKWYFETFSSGTKMGPMKSSGKAKRYIIPLFICTKPSLANATWGWHDGAQLYAAPSIYLITIAGVMYLMKENSRYYVFSQLFWKLIHRQIDTLQSAWTTIGMTCTSAEMFYTPTKIKGT